MHLRGEDNELHARIGSQGLRIDRDIGHIELGVVDYGSLTVVSASPRFYDWINRPRMQRVSLLELLPGLDPAAVHQALEAFDGVCELEGNFLAAGGTAVSLRIRLLKTGQTLVSPLRLLAFDISELRKKEEILRTVSKLLESHKALIAESRKTLKVLLDSLPQAVFLVDASLHITSEISRKAEELFGAEVEHAALSELLRCSEEDLEPLRLAFSGIEWDLMVGVLPTEFTTNERVFSVGFIPVLEYEFLACVTVVITDITERRRMERSLEQTDADNRALVAILASKDEFIDLVNLARRAAIFVDDLHSLRSIVHGLKGGFSFLDCDKLAGMCHRAEDKFLPEIYTPDIGRRFMEELNGELRAFTNRYQHVLQFESRADADIASRQLQLDYDVIGTIYEQAEREGSSANLLNSLERLVELPAQRLLGWLDKAWLKTLAGESKEGMSITWGGDVALSREPYKELFQSFVHIIRNAADHGIELPAERERHGKSRAGSMHIEVSYQDGIYLFTFEDDGAGIDPDALVAVARSRGIYVPDTISRQQALMLICEPGFSSRTQVTALSGRGIGVDAVRRAAQLCGGDVSVESTLGRGTKISVWFKRQRYWR
jgi:two-component system chemotaxis sensor kinase CheA